MLFQVLMKLLGLAVHYLDERGSHHVGPARVLSSLALEEGDSMKLIFARQNYYAH